MKKYTPSLRGFTLIELLVGITISTFIVTLTSRIYLSGHSQFMARSQEAEDLRHLFLLTRTIQKALQNPISKCQGGQIEIEREEKKIILKDSLLEIYPEIKSLKFICLEADTLQNRLTEWKDRFEPQLIEYTGVWKSKGSERMIFGSWLK